MNRQIHVLHGEAIANALSNEAGNAGDVRSAVGIADDLQTGAEIASVFLREWAIAHVSQNATRSASAFWSVGNVSAPVCDVALHPRERDWHAVSGPPLAVQPGPVAARLYSACEVPQVPVSRTRPAPSHSARCSVSRATMHL